MNAPTPQNCLNKSELRDQNKYLVEVTIIQAQTVVDLSAKLGEMCALSNTLAAQLYALVDAHDANDQEAIALQLKVLSERRKSFKKPEVH